MKYRIDIKKPLDDAAKMVEPFVTGDALLQQLVKRRNRYLDELQRGVHGGDDDDDNFVKTEVATPTSTVKTPGSTTKTPASLAKTPASLVKTPVPTKKSTKVC